MLKNQKQASVAKVRLEELKKEKLEFVKQYQIHQDAKYRLGVKSFDGLIKELESEISEYEGLSKGNFHCLQAKSFGEIPKVLIAARLAQKISQKQLGEKVGLKEQQIQRYEATDYETASWPRLFEISIALGLKFTFEKILIINYTEEKRFSYSKNITKEQIAFAARSIKERGAMIIN